MEPPTAPHAEPGSVGEVLRAFTYLGLTSFGGPIAHLGHFREELVKRRHWTDEAGYADLVALCQFLPGPASSQVGFALGLLRAGPLGGLAAWAAFTLPSAILLSVFAYGAASLSAGIGPSILQGLKLVAVAIVAHAVWGMARSLTPDPARLFIALCASVIVLASTGPMGQIAAIAIGALAGLWLCRAGPAAMGTMGILIPRRIGALCLAAFAVLLMATPLLAHFTDNHGFALFDAFYRSGALVFGGGHVVLPLLQAETVPTGWVSDDAFLAGYGAAQAVPGPLFTFAAYLGWIGQPFPNGAAGAAIALVAIFLPGLLLVGGALPFWDAFRIRPGAQAALKGTNAAVVGILAAALYDPVWTSSVHDFVDFAIAGTGFLALLGGVRAWAVVLMVTAATAALASV